MAKISIQPNVFTPGYSAHLPDGLSNPQPTLSFMDSMALQSTARGIWDLTAETRGAKRELESMNYQLDGVADGLRSLESGLGLRLDQQTQILEEQSSLLLQIRDAMLTPNKTRAAERVADGAQLLRKTRYERAKKVAQEGIDADPNNPAVFSIAGWACAGLNEADEACEMFEEASAAADGDERSLAARQAARAALIGERYELAYALVRDARAAAKSADEKAALNYDIAICAWANDDKEAAVEAMSAACTHDTLFCLAALLDMALKKATPVKKVAGQVLRKQAKETAKARTSAEALVDKLAHDLPDPPQLSYSHHELGAEIRPERDAEVTYRAVAADLEIAETALEESLEAENLQASKRCLDEAQACASEGLGLIPDLEEDIKAHEEADARHGEVAGLTKTLQSRHESAQSKLGKAETAVRKTGTLAKFGMAFVLAGLLLPDLLPVGVLMVVPFIVAFVIRLMFKSERSSLESQVSTGRAELSPGAGTRAPDAGGLADAGAFRRLGATHAALGVCFAIAEQYRSEGQLDDYARIEFAIAESLLELARFDKAGVEAQKALVAAQQLEDKTLIGKAQALISRVAEES